MQVSQVGSMMDLIDLYREQDTDRDGVLEAGEVTTEAIADFDRDDNHTLSPWEVMEARGRTIFPFTEIEVVRRLNNEDRAFPMVEVTREISIGAWSFPAGTQIEVGNNGDFLRVILGPEGHTIEDICFRGGTFITYTNLSPRVIEGVIESDAVVSGIRVRGGTRVLINYSYHTYLLEGVLAEDTVVAGVRFLGGTMISFDPQHPHHEVRGILAQDLRVGRLSFPRGANIALVGWDVRFANDLRNTDDSLLRSEIRLNLPEDRTIRGVTYRRGTWLGFYTYTGRVSRGTIDQDTRIRRINFRAGTEVKFENNRLLIGATLVEDTIIDGIRFLAGTEVFFNGCLSNRVSGGVLAENNIIHDMRFARGTRITLDENLHIYSATLVEDMIIQDVEFRRGTEVEFYTNGQVRDGILSHDTVVGGIPDPFNGGIIGGIPFQSGARIFFHEDGTVFAGVVARDVVVEHTSLSVGEQALFSNAGEILLHGNNVYRYIEDFGGLLGVNFNGELNVRGVRYISSVDSSGRMGNITFSLNGQVSEGVLAVDTEIDGIRFLGGTVICYAYDGSVAHGTLAEDTVIHGRRYRAGTDWGFVHGRVVWGFPQQRRLRETIRQLNEGPYIVAPH